MSWDFAMNERLHHRSFAPKFSSAHAVHSVFLQPSDFDLFRFVSQNHHKNMLQIVAKGQLISELLFDVFI